MLVYQHAVKVQHLVFFAPGTWKLDRKPAVQEIFEARLDIQDNCDDA